MGQLIALIDGNNFYASCEKSIDPTLNSQPLVVLSNNDGCIIARSSEARELGIQMGQPFFKVKEKLLNMGVIIKSSNYSLYGDMSHRLMQILKSNCEELEIYSIDEAFARIAMRTKHDLRPWAQKLRALVYKQLGLAIAIGIGNNKVQAKMANHIAKSSPTHAGIFDLTMTKDSEEWMKSIEIENIWGIGPKLSEWLQSKGIRTAQQLKAMPSHELKAKYGIVGIRIQNELKGEICLQLNSHPKPKKTTCVSRSLRKPIQNLEEFLQVVSLHVIRTGSKLRKQKQIAGSITIFSKTTTFSRQPYSKAAKKNLDPPTSDTSLLLKEAKLLAKQIYQNNLPFTKIGVLVENLQSQSYLQKNIFDKCTEQSQSKKEQLTSAIDRINDRYGHNSITWAASGLKKVNNTRNEYLSRSATTKLMEIPIVKA